MTIKSRQSWSKASNRLIDADHYIMVEDVLKSRASMASAEAAKMTFDDARAFSRKLLDEGNSYRSMEVDNLLLKGLVS